jgi:ribosomal protein S18 acetylase RimI-like enzyme
MNNDITIKLVETEQELLEGVNLKIAHEAECEGRTIDETFASFALKQLNGRQGHTFYFARKNEQLVGLAHGGSNDGMYHIDAVYVAPEYRKQGIGTSLAKLLIEDAKNRNCMGMVSEAANASEASKKLHEKLGFDIDGKSGILVLEKYKGEK